MPFGVQQTGRVPPHNLEAEESLLGAMLLSRDAITAAVEARVETTDFYKPAHGHIYDAVQSLYGAGRARRPGHRRRGAAPRRSPRLHRRPRRRCCRSRPTRRRRRTRVTTRASSTSSRCCAGSSASPATSPRWATTTPDDVTETLDRAESLVFEVAERRVSDSMVGIRDALQDTLDQLEARYGDDSELVGVPTGYNELDDEAARAAARRTS